MFRASTRGAMYFDDFVSTRLAYIGAGTAMNLSDTPAIPSTDRIREPGNLPTPEGEAPVTP